MEEIGSSGGPEEAIHIDIDTDSGHVVTVVFDELDPVEGVSGHFLSNIVTPFRDPSPGAISQAFSAYEKAATIVEENYEGVHLPAEDTLNFSLSRYAAGGPDHDYARVDGGTTGDDTSNVEVTAVDRDTERGRYTITAVNEEGNEYNAVVSEDGWLTDLATPHTEATEETARELAVAYDAVCGAIQDQGVTLDESGCLELYRFGEA